MTISNDLVTVGQGLGMFSLLVLGFANAFLSGRAKTHAVEAASLAQKASTDVLSVQQAVSVLANGVDGKLEAAVTLAHAAGFVAGASSVATIAANVAGKAVQGGGTLSR